MLVGNNVIYEQKKGLKRVIIDPVYLNPLLIVWGTSGQVTAIYVVAQHFCEVHDSNPITLELAGVTKSETPTNAPHP